MPGAAGAEELGAVPASSSTSPAKPSGNRGGAAAADSSKKWKAPAPSPSPARRASLEKTADPFLLPGLRWFLAPGDVFSDDEVVVIEVAFKRFQVPHTREMHRDFLCDLIRFLGYPRVRPEDVAERVSEVTSFTELDVDEVQSVVASFARAERERLREAWATFAGRSREGLLPAGEAGEFIAAAGFVPDPALLVEILGEEADHHLSFEDALTLIVEYQRVHGFPRTDVSRLRRIFRSLEQQPPRRPSRAQRSRGAKWRKTADADPDSLPGLPLPSLVDALIVAFGMQIEGPICRVMSKMHAGEGLLSPSRRHGDVGSELLGFAEVLALARRARETQLEEWRVAYDRLREDHRLLPGVGLAPLLRSLDYEPLQSSLDVLREQVGVASRHSDLSFLDVAAILRSFDASCGLSDNEVKELRSAFQRRGEQGAGAITFAALGEILQSFGFAAQLSGDLRLFASRCELDHKGTLELPEFLKVMAAHRADELKRLRKLFISQGEAEEVVDAIGLTHEAALDALSGAADGFVPRAALEALNKAPIGVDFDTFVALADVCRRRGVEARKRHGGFKESEIAGFRARFDTFDKEGSGVVPTSDLQALLDKLGVAVRTREEQRAMREKLDEARQLARDAGGQGVTAPGAALFGFWELVQLVRLLRCESDRAAEADAERAAEELRFSAPEQAQFRRIFGEWARLEAGLASPVLGAGAAAAEPEIPEGSEGGISLDTLHRLLRSIGVNASAEQKKDLEVRVEEVLGVGDRAAALTFVDFLHMMRWLLDTDFAGINGVAATTAAQKQRDKLSENLVLS